MVLQLERLESRDTPSAILGSDGILRVQPSADFGHHAYGVIVRQGAGDLIVSETHNHVTSITVIPAAGIHSMIIRGQAHERNVFDNRTGVATTYVGSDKEDSIRCGSGYNLVGTGLGYDTVYSLRGGLTVKLQLQLNVIDRDIIYTHRNFGSVQPNPMDRVIFV